MGFEGCEKLKAPVLEGFNGKTGLIWAKIDPHNRNPRRRWQSPCSATPNPSPCNRIFTPRELSEIEREALDMGRKRFSPELAKIDKALIERAAQGDTAVVKLAYQGFEN